MPKKTILSKYYPVLKSDPDYRFLLYLQHVTYTLKPSIEENAKASKPILSYCENLAKEARVLLISIDDMENENDREKYFKSASSKLNLTREGKNQFEDLCESIPYKNNLRQLFSESIEHYFGIENTKEGGLFWIEAFENGLNAKFVHINDILNLDDTKRNDFLKNLFIKQFNSFEPLEIFTPTPIYKFEGLEISEDILDRLGDKELTSLSAFLYELRKKRREEKKIKLIIEYRNLSYKVFIPDIDQEVELYPKDKALYFLILLYSNGIDYYNLGDYEVSLIDILGKIKSQEKEVTIKTVKNLIEKNEIMKPTKSNTNKSIKKLVNEFYKGDESYCKVITEEITYIRDSQILKILVDRDAISGISNIKKLLVKPLKTE